MWESTSDIRKSITYIFKKHKVLNGHQVCRLINGFGKDEFRRCYYSFKEKPKGTRGMGCRNQVDHECLIYHSRLYSILIRMKNLDSVKMRFYDKGGIKTDIFRFYFLDRKDFERIILSQTMLGYIKNTIL